MDLLLVFQRWSRQAGALFQPIRFKVLLSVTKVSAHVWSLDAIQAIIGSSYLVFEASPRLVTGSNLSSFYIVARLDTLTSSLLRWVARVLTGRALRRGHATIVSLSIGSDPL
jgi:hypothetical protein